MKILTNYPLHSILLGFILSALLIGFGIVYDMSMLTTIGGLVLGLSIGGVVILYGVLILCISFWR